MLLLLFLGAYCRYTAWITDELALTLETERDSLLGEVGPRGRAGSVSARMYGMYGPIQNPALSESSAR